MNPPLSIGLPVYNAERYLPQTLDSLLTQTYGDFELVISDNASTDATESICREHAGTIRGFDMFAKTRIRGRSGISTGSLSLHAVGISSGRPVTISARRHFSRSAPRFSTETMRSRGHIP